MNTALTGDVDGQRRGQRQPACRREVIG